MSEPHKPDFAAKVSDGVPERVPVKTPYGQIYFDLSSGAVPDSPDLEKARAIYLALTLDPPRVIRAFWPDYQQACEQGDPQALIRCVDLLKAIGKYPALEFLREPILDSLETCAETLSEKYERQEVDDGDPESLDIFRREHLETLELEHHLPTASRNLAQIPCQPQAQSTRTDDDRHPAIRPRQVDVPVFR